MKQASISTAIAFLVMSNTAFAQGFAFPNIQLPQLKLPMFMSASAPQHNPHSNPVNDFSNGTKLYAGGAVGYSSQGDTCNDPFFDGTCDDADMSWKLYGGARFNPMMGVEAAYHNFGKASMDGLNNGQSASLKNDVTGFSVAGVGYVPVTPEIEAYGKAGLAFWERESEKSNHLATVNSSDDGQSPIIGLGAQYRFNENLHLRGEWEHLFNVGSDSGYETDVNSYNVGVMYSTL